MLRLSANLSTMFTELPPVERVAAAREAGFVAIEMQFPYATDAAVMAAACRGAGVKVVLINVPAGERAAGELGLACLPGQEARFRAALDQALDYADALGCRQLNSLAGRYPQAVDRERCWQTLVDNSIYAAQRCAGRGLTLLSEVLNPVDIEDFVLSRASDGERLLRDAQHANLKLQFDLYHRVAAGEDWEALLRTQVHHVAHIQFSDHPGRHEPGTGRIDWPRFFGVLEELPYEGYVGCEYFPSKPTGETLGWLEWTGQPIRN